MSWMEDETMLFAMVLWTGKQKGGVSTNIDMAMERLRLAQKIT